MIARQPYAGRSQRGNPVCKMPVSQRALILRQIPRRDDKIKGAPLRLYRRYHSLIAIPGIYSQQRLAFIREEVRVGNL